MNGLHFDRKENIATVTMIIIQMPIKSAMIIIVAICTGDMLDDAVVTADVSLKEEDDETSVITLDESPILLLLLLLLLVMVVVDGVPVNKHTIIQNL